MKCQKPLDERTLKSMRPRRNSPMSKLQSTLLLALCAGLSAQALAQTPANP